MSASCEAQAQHTRRHSLLALSPTLTPMQPDCKLDTMIEACGAVRHRVPRSKLCTARVHVMPW